MLRRELTTLLYCMGMVACSRSHPPAATEESSTQSAANDTPSVVRVRCIDGAATRSTGILWIVDARSGLTGIDAGRVE